MYDGIFLSQHCIRTEVKVLPPAEDPIATPRMSQSEVTSPCSCDHAIAKIYLQKCDVCAGNFAGAQCNRGHDPLIDFVILTSAFVRSQVLEVVYRTGHRYNTNASWKPLESYGTTPSHSSTAISSVLHANF
jgi:hypothetical protein